MSPQPELRLGVDVGGTNTDAVVLDSEAALLAKVKVPTTDDVTSGIAAAVRAVLEKLEAPRELVGYAMLGTTHATNAVLERRNLEHIAVVRIGGPATKAIPPLLTWPDELREVVSAGEAIIDGGSEYDGRELAPFDRDALSRFLEPHLDEINGVAITSVFAPVSDTHELEARELVRSIAGDLPVSLSHEIGSIGLLERENATALNATLTRVARQVTGAFDQALEDNGISPITFFAQNDGTLMALDYVLRFPVLTIGSGPANSMRGGAYLSGLENALIVDVGGTSTDIGMLVGRFPRESSSPVEIGGVRTNFRMPDLVSIALGGGTILRSDDGSVSVGPDSVGYRVTEEALVFGGKTPTLTDALVAMGRSDVGNGKVDGLDQAGELFERAVGHTDRELTEAVDRMKTSRELLPLIVVGGGSALVPDRLDGVSDVVRPDHFEVANAIGAAIATVTGQIDRIFSLEEQTREKALEAARQLAIDEAIAAGADAERVELVDLEEIAIAYMAKPVLRIRARAAGPLALI